MKKLVLVCTAAACLSLFGAGCLSPEPQVVPQAPIVQPQPTPSPTPSPSPTPAPAPTPYSY